MAVGPSHEHTDRATKTDHTHRLQVGNTLSSSLARLRAQQSLLLEYKARPDEKTTAYGQYYSYNLVIESTRDLAQHARRLLGRRTLRFELEEISPDAAEEDTAAAVPVAVSDSEEDIELVVVIVAAEKVISIWSRLRHQYPQMRLRIIITSLVVSPPRLCTATATRLRNGCRVDRL